MMSSLWLGWVLVALAGYALFQLHPNGFAKRRGYPPFVVGMALLYLLSIWWAFPPWGAGVLGICTVVLVAWTLVTTRFCQHCGHLVSILFPWTSRHACPYCGVALVPRA